MQDCDAHLELVRAKILKHAAANPGHRYLILNLGVNDSAKGVCLESKAKNWMQFRVPDVRGNCPLNLPIDQEAYKQNAASKAEDFL